MSEEHNDSGNEFDPVENMDKWAPKRGYGDPRQDTIEEYRKVMGELNPFRRAFVEAFLKTESAAEAARAAGSTAKNPDRVGYNTLQIPEVQRAVALAMFRRIEAVALDSTEVIANFREVFNKAMEDGKYAEANKATENLARILGLFSDAKTNAQKNIDKNTKELNDASRDQRNGPPDEVAGMLSILDKVRVREGTRDDPRLAPENGSSD